MLSLKDIKQILPLGIAVKSTAIPVTGVLEVFQVGGEGMEIRAVNENAPIKEMTSEKKPVCFFM